MLLAITEVVILLLALGFALGGLLGAVWVPVRKADIYSIIEALELSPGVTVIEFGCGDGRFLRLAASKGATAIGYEVNPFLWLLAWVLCSTNSRITVRLGNAWNKPFGSADVVFAFLVPKFMERLGAKLKSELKSGTKVATYIFPIPGAKHKRHANNCYFYEF